MDMEASYVVIGGGIAGISCIESISILDENASIILISASRFIKAVTNITPITKMLTEFQIEEKTLDYVSSKFPSSHVIIDTAIRINSKERTVTTSGNHVIKYAKLCICTGARPKVISIENEYVISIRDTDSAETLQNKLKDAKRIMVVGNGGIATEIVYEVEGVEIIWAIKDAHITAAFVDPGAAEFFQYRLKGVNKNEKPVIRTLKYTEEGDFKTEAMGAALGPYWHNKLILENDGGTSSNLIIEYEVEVISVESEWCSPDEKWPVFVRLSNGKMYGCDFVISATGVIPNGTNISIEDDVFALASDHGIKVNERMETSVLHIYAAGDVCTAAWDYAQHWLQMRLWDQARQMGYYAGRCMVEAMRHEITIQDFCFELFTHVTRFFGYKVILLGLFNAQKLEKDYELLLRVTKGEEYVKLVVSKGILQGAVLIGDTELEEMCENLILNQLNISELGENLLNPNVDIEDYFD